MNTFKKSMAALVPAASLLALTAIPTFAAETQAGNQSVKPTLGVVARAQALSTRQKADAKGERAPECDYLGYISSASGTMLIFNCGGTREYVWR